MLQNVFSKKSKIEEETEFGDGPSITLGCNPDTSADIIQRGEDRLLNNLIIGGSATGKTQHIALPILSQDLQHFATFIENNPKVSYVEDYPKALDSRKHYLNGISVIEPFGTACEQIQETAQTHGVREDAIKYINPLDPDTLNINIMNESVETVVDMLDQVLIGMIGQNDETNYFFGQLQRNHLKHYVYLLKMHDESQEVTLDMLLDMYNDPHRVHTMHMHLKERIPQDLELIEDREIYNRWKMVQIVDEWFDKHLVLVRDNGKTYYVDTQSEYVQGLRTVLNDIGANPKMRRVLFNKSSFNFDMFVESGGVLLCNTAKGEMGRLSNVLGQFVLLSLQNAIFRRGLGDNPYHHILIDEANDYVNDTFYEFLAQNRRYKCITTAIIQSFDTLPERFIPHFALLFRNRIICGDLRLSDEAVFGKFAIKNGMSYEMLEEQPESSWSQIAYTAHLVEKGQSLEPQPFEPNV